LTGFSTGHINRVGQLDGELAQLPSAHLYGVLEEQMAEPLDKNGQLAYSSTQALSQHLIFGGAHVT